jgi:nucleotide-binding universal stress UspA family protein
MRLVVGFDGSDHSKRALERAAGLAGKEGHVFVVSAIPDNAQASDMVVRNRLLEEAVAALTARGVPHTPIEGSGKPAAAIGKAAEENSADMIVVGSRGLGAAASLLLGSCSYSLVHGASHDVLVVR